MIGRLTGHVVEDAADGTLVVDVAGVGYEVLAPLGTLGRAPPDASGAVTLWVHTHLREDALLLYGFASRDDRAAFRTLISVSGVGPKIAVSILSVLSAGGLAEAVARREPSRLTAIPGVGKKTAERLVLELKDKLIAPLGAGVAPTPPPAQKRGTVGDPKADVLHGTLTRLGWRPAEVDRAVATLGERVTTDPMPELVREALALLSR